MTTSTAGVRAKLARALVHLRALDDRIDAFLATSPLDLVQQISPDGQTRMFFVRQRTPPDLELSVLVGEVVHQTRSSVDHLAHLLVTTSGNTPTRQTSFPICLKPPKDGLRVTGGVTRPALKIVDQFQPYQRRNPAGHPLAVLNALWNVDKHRNLALTTCALRNTQLFAGSPDGSALFGGQFQTGTLKPGDPIGGFAFDGPVPDELEIEGQGQMFVTLAEPGGWPADQPVTYLLADLHEFVVTQLLATVETHLHA